MAPGKTTLQLLKNYLSKQNSNDADYQFSCELKEFRIQVNLNEFDKFSLVVETLQVEWINAFESCPDLVRKQADFLKNNLTYLLENFEVFEIDKLQSKAQLRSHVPDEDDTSLSYFEIIITGGRSITLARWVFDKDSKQKKPGNFQLTNEILEKIINDFVKTIELEK